MADGHDITPEGGLGEVAGFVAYGLEPEALVIDGTAHDELWMTLPLR